MNTKLLHRWNMLRASFWFIPSLMLFCAIVSALAMISLDSNIRLQPDSRLSMLQNISAEGARAILSMIAQSLITVTSIAFSITIVVLTLASSQFGPRLLRNFMADTGNQIVLGTFISTFVYCLLVLRIITSTSELTFVPGFSISFAVVLAIINVGVLIYFIHHIAISIQADHIVASVRKDLEKHIEQMFPHQWERLAESTKNIFHNTDMTGADGQDLIATRSGYLQVTDKTSLLELSQKYNLVINLHSSPGDFVIAGMVIMTVKYPRNPCDDELTKQLTDAFYLGSQRTPEQDPEFALRQLVEVAIRALSPSLNDPFTAMICIDQLSATLCQLAQRKFPSPFTFDQQGNLRLIEKPITFSRLVKEAFDQIRQYGRSSTAVNMRLLGALTSIAQQTRTIEQREAISRQAKMIKDISEITLPDADDRADVQRRYGEFLDIVAQLEGLLTNS